MTIEQSDLEARARRHAALGDPGRLAIVDELSTSDRAPVELGDLLGIPSNLMAHHLVVLEEVGLISRSRSSGDGRRRYVHLHREVFDEMVPGRTVDPQPVLFVCSANSARSQLASALWESLTDQPATSAGTHPAIRVHPGALAAAKRAGLDMKGAIPTALDDVRRRPGLVITVCDQAHEELDAPPTWLHWSVPDPVAEGTNAAFDAVVSELRDRIGAVVQGRDRRTA
ncbi:MAG: helix-turn-helix domain-containing protein [Acidimicrobiales bacterium]